MSKKSIHRSDFAETMVNSGFMFLYMLIFSVLGVFFMFGGLNPWIELFIGLAFAVPVMIIYFYLGGQEGAREFKRLNGISADSAKSGAVKVPNIAKGLLYVLPYAVFSLLIAAVCWIADNQVFKVILLMIFMPAAILGQATGVIVYPREVVYDKGLETEYTVIEGATSGLSVFAVIAVFVVISCAVFLAAYARKIRQSRDTFNSFMSEIVMNEKFWNR